MSDMQLRTRRCAPIVTDRDGRRGFTFYLKDADFAPIDAQAKRHGISHGTLARLLMEHVSANIKQFAPVIDKVMAKARGEEQLRRNLRASPTC